MLILNLIWLAVPFQHSQTHAILYFRGCNLNVKCNSCNLKQCFMQMDSQFKLSSLIKLSERVKSTKDKRRMVRNGKFWIKSRKIKLSQLVTWSLLFFGWGGALFYSSTDSPSSERRWGGSQQLALIDLITWAVNPQWGLFKNSLRSFTPISARGKGADEEPQG